MTPAVRRASAIVVGAGALGSTAAAHLVGAGVGQLGVVDSEPVTAESLRHAPLQWTPDVGASRAGSVASKLGLMTPDALVEPYPVRLEQMNAAAIVAGADLVLDCSGSEETRDVVIRACLEEGAPLVTGAVRGLEARVMAARPGETACWRCAHPAGAELPPAEGDRWGLGHPAGPRNDGAAGDAWAHAALGALAGIAGSLQALQALALLDRGNAGGDEPAGAGGAPAELDAVLTIDGRSLAIRRVPAPRRAGCPACAEAGGRPQSV